MRKFILEDRNPNSRYNSDWSETASSPISPKVAIANFKKMNRGVNDPIARGKQHGYEYRIRTIEITEETVSIENL